MNYRLTARRMECMRDFHMADELLTFTCKSNGAEGTYSGLVHRGLAHAYGVLTLAGGNTYCGEFNRGEQDGLGCWQYTGSNIIEWTGAVRGGRREGFGELRFADGRRYAGECRADRLDGLGVLTFPSGEASFGKWVAGKRTLSLPFDAQHPKHMEIVSAAEAAKVDSPVPRKPAIAYWGARPHASSCGAHPFGRHTLCCAGEGRGMQSTFHRRKGARLVGRSHLSLHKPLALRAPKHV